MAILRELAQKKQGIGMCYSERDKISIVGQANLNPTVASMLMSLDAVFSVLAGLVVLHQMLSGREILGCVLMFVAVVLAQLPEPKRKSTDSDEAGK